MTPNILAISWSGWIQWNISNCEVQDVLVWKNRTKRNQFSVKETHSIINKCDNSIMSTYEDISITWFWFLIIWFIGFVFVCIWHAISN